ncbi:NADH-quinone oxidoreductase subunit G [Modestobacter sp. VKM Ac-2983]|uniref:NADH-quinone oxidoreductase subunit G n=1 Tax=Modestobacter sp. VKM Ac-2983 TaxID=3004137 RepID=UPI0022ABBB1C|nr:NADH-quinone oxidoreductase subunit G [Modestobacter sp. VKM Ac-2983]MCZ2806285.1 NADH-quinone oxidoreductase subunit G [Modestobacter sp. VKM Ac-2983]
MTLTPATPEPAPALPPGAPGPHTPPDAVHCTIDGFPVAVPKGTLIIRAAEQIGVQIPRFCDHPLLDPIGACRQCLVEVEGQRKPVASCTTPVTPDMVVQTQLTSPVADKAQQGTMELLLVNHPLDCPVCDKGGECPLQNQAMSNGRSESRFVETKRTYPKPLPISSQVLLDRERCVLCARCTRFSQQVAGDPFIELFERGALEQVAIYEDEPFESYFSGNTTQICPVGALTSATYRFRARPFDLRSEPSVCEHCASGCAQRTDYRRGTVTRRLAGEDPAVNEEWNCDKGRYAFRYASSNERLMTPLVRRDGELQPASWPEAWAAAAEGLRAARAAGGVGVLPGGRLTVEDAYAYAAFARVALGTNDVDARARAHSAEELDFLATHVAGTAPGAGAVSYDDLTAAPAVLLVGFEPEEESPIVFLRLRRAVRTAGMQVFDVAPFGTRAAEKLQATVLTTVPGQEAQLLRDLAANPVDGVLADAAVALFRPGAVILAGERLAELPGGFSAVSALAAETGARIGWVPRRAGERGAVEAGALPTLLPGGRTVANAADRAAVAQRWGADVPATPGRDLTGILAAVRDGGLAGLLVGGVDPADLPDPLLAEQALQTARFVVSLELFPTAVTAHADVVLPVAAAPEKAGSYLDWEGRVRSFDATLHGSGQLTDGRVLQGLAEHLGVDLRVGSVTEVRAQLTALGGAAQAPADTGADVAPAPLPELADDQAVLASWRQLVDVGTLQREEPALAGTARPPVARLGKDAARRLGVADGDPLTVTGPAGAVTLPVRLVEMPDGVVWLPMRSPGSEVRAQLGAGPGSVVRLAGPPPTPAGASSLSSLRGDQE